MPHGTVQCVRTIQYGTCMYDTAVEEGGVIGHLSYSTLLGSLNVLYRKNSIDPLKGILA